MKIYIVIIIKNKLLKYFKKDNTFIYYCYKEI